MGSKMLIDASQREETRVVVARGNRIEEFDFESISRKPLKGNIYLAKVTRVEPSLQAAFVEYGGNRHGFLAFAEIHPDYYQIPIADRLALIKEQEEDDAAQEEEDRRQDGEASSSDNEAASEEESTDGHAEQGDEDHHPDEFQSDETVSRQSMALDTETQPAIASDDSGDSADDDQLESSAIVSTNGELIAIEEDVERSKVESIGAEDALEEVPQRPRR